MNQLDTRAVIIPQIIFLGARVTIYPRTPYTNVMFPT